MPIHFDEKVSHVITVVKEIIPHSKEMWVPIELCKLLEHKGTFISIDNLTVRLTSDNHVLPWIVNWNNIPLLPCIINSRDYLKSDIDTSQGYHGYTNLTEGWDSSKLPQVLKRNIEEFAFSTFQSNYMELKREFIHNRKISEKYADHIERFYMDEMRREGGIECIMISSNEENGSKGPLVAFIYALLQNDSTLKLLEYFSNPIYEKLFKYGLNLEPGPNQEHFPLHLPVKISKCSPCELLKVIPMSAVKNVVMFFQELEQNNYLYYISEKEFASPIVHVLVPPETAMKVLVELKFSHGIGWKNSMGMASNDPPMLLLNDLNYQAMARSHSFISYESEEQLESVLKKYEGIANMKCTKRISFY